MRRERFLIPTSGFKGPVVKPEAISREVLDLKSLPSGGLSAGPGEERILHPGPAWLGDVRPAERLTFAGYRPDDETLRLCLVLAVDPEADRLVLFSLAGGRSPLEVLAEPREKCALKRLVREVGEGADIPSGSLVLSLSRLLKEGRLGTSFAEIWPRLCRRCQLSQPPGGGPGPSRAEREALGAAPGATPSFPQAPPVAPSGPALPGVPPEFSCLLGPFDKLTYPETNELPPERPGERNPVVVTRLEYEAEIGVVLGQVLTWETARKSSDEELRAAVAGYLLVSDAKARNPQVMGKIVHRDEQPPGDNAYRIGDPALDRAFGIWDGSTCRWWSYAAGWGATPRSALFWWKPRVRSCRPWL